VSARLDTLDFRPGTAGDAAIARGFTAMRLFTPADQARARRFYEREGWTVAGAPFTHEDLHLSMVEYRRVLSPVPRSS
jgi:hypothetical protein